MPWIKDQDILMEQSPTQIEQPSIYSGLKLQVATQFYL